MHSGIKRISGRWGHFNIEYGIYGNDFECVICGFRAAYEDETHEHVKNAHGLSKRMEHTAKELGIKGYSRIDRFSQIQRELGGRNMCRVLTKTVRERGKVAVPYPPESSGLNARSGN